MRSMKRAGVPIAALAITVVLVVGAERTRAQHLPALPPRVSEVLGQLGINTSAGPSALFGDWNAAFRVPVKDPELVEVMERARTGDLVLPLDHRLFAPETAEVGHFHSDFFLA